MEQNKKALFAGGCFWCVEADFLKISDGLVNVVSGYAGGTTDNPTYENYSKGGHREVVEVTYNPSIVSFKDLVEYFVRHIDPTDGGGSFYDRGHGYSPAIYYATPEEKQIAEEVLAAAAPNFDAPLQVAIEPMPTFWLAEDYHQQYATKNPTRYTAYRNASGRDAFMTKQWQGRELRIHLPGRKEPVSKKDLSSLTPLQYEVTQQCGTETPFQNEYWDEHRDGIYVDIVSGEPLYSSTDKYDSGTGWPSFVKPIKTDAITTKEDNKLFATRTEVRSKVADSHLGHVFNDGPKDRGGLRYCMNSAALRFIPKENLEKEKYGEYLKLFE